MKKKNIKIKSFKDLNAWKEGHKLVIEIYKLTMEFPREERYGLTDQLRRASISITSNLAEGFSRQGKKEKLQFYYMSKGSLTEVQNQLLVAKDVGYLHIKDFRKVADQTVIVHKLINGLVKSAKSKSK